MGRTCDGSSTMLQPIHVLRLSVAVLAVAIGVLWVRSWGAPTWDPRTEFAYSNLGIPWKDGKADLSNVELLVLPRNSAASRYDLELRGDGSGTYLSEFGPKPTGRFEFATDRVHMESWLGELDALDFMNAEHSCTYRSPYHYCDRRWTLRVGSRVGSYRDFAGDYEDRTATDHERAWHARLGALFNRITRDVNVAQWQGEATR